MEFGNVKNLGTWGTALVASVAVHVVVLGLMLGMRGCGDSPSQPPAMPQTQTDGRATDLPPSHKPDEETANDDTSKSETQKTNATKNDFAKTNRLQNEPVKNATKKTTEKKPEQKKAETKKTKSGKTEIKRPDLKHSAAKSSDAEPVTKHQSPITNDQSSNTKASDEWISYKVRPGDSLTKIARTCGCTVAELAKANNLSPTTGLNVGQTIKIKKEADE